MYCHGAKTNSFMRRSDISSRGYELQDATNLKLKKIENKWPLQWPEGSVHGLTRDRDTKG